jgi:hypothetical protein
MKDQGQASKAAPINHSGSGNDSTLESQFADHKAAIRAVSAGQPQLLRVI